MVKRKKVKKKLGIAPTAQEVGNYNQSRSDNAAQPARHLKVPKGQGFMNWWQPYKKGEFLWDKTKYPAQPCKFIGDTIEDDVARMEKMVRDINNPFHSSYFKHIAFLMGGASFIPSWKKDARRHLKMKWSEFKDKFKLRKRK